MKKIPMKYLMMAALSLIIPAGIACAQEMTLEEIGERLDLTRERVRQIKEKAIRKLKKPSASKLLKTYLG